MAKFIIRNDDVASDTDIEEIRKFCEICDRHGFQIIQAIVPLGEPRKIKSSRMDNEEIKSLSNQPFSRNRKVLEYLKNRNDLIGLHGLWHTHKPSIDEIKIGKSMLEQLGFNPIYFIPPFNEGNYENEVLGLKTCKLSLKSGERLEDFLKEGTPKAKIMYLHSWRFDNSWYTFDELDKCLQRLQ